MKRCRGDDEGRPVVCVCVGLHAQVELGDVVFVVRTIKKLSKDGYSASGKGMHEQYRHQIPEADANHGVLRLWYREHDVALLARRLHVNGLRADGHPSRAV